MALLTQYARKPLVLPKKGFLIDSSLVLCAPLWHPHLSLSPFLTKDPYQHTCTVVGALRTPQGRSFDGIDDEIIVPGDDVLDTPTALVVEVWAKANVDAGMNIVSKWLPAGNNRSWSTRLLAGAAFGLRVTSDGTIATMASSTPVNGVVGAWNHFVAVYNGTQIYVVVNGVEGSRTPYTAGIFSGIADVRLGYLSTTGWWNGLIGEVRVYSRVVEARHNRLVTKWRYAHD